MNPVMMEQETATAHQVLADLLAVSQLAVTVSLIPMRTVMTVTT
jgi:hypothetical protein